MSYYDSDSSDEDLVVEYVDGFPVPVVQSPGRRSPSPRGSPVRSTGRLSDESDSEEDQVVEYVNGFPVVQSQSRRSPSPIRAATPRRSPVRGSHTGNSYSDSDDDQVVEYVNGFPVVQPGRTSPRRSPFSRTTPIRGGPEGNVASPGRRFRPTYTSSPNTSFRGSPASDNYSRTFNRSGSRSPNTMRDDLAGIPRHSLRQRREGRR